MQSTARTLAAAERAALGLLLLGALLLAGRAWLADHPQHDPRAPLDLAHERGWATSTKLDALRGDPAACHQVLARGGIDFTVLPTAGEGACRREDRVRLAEGALSPAAPEMSCAIAASYLLWLRHDVQPAAQRRLGAEVARVEHYGTFACRRQNNAEAGRWSEHATANALDIAGFVLSDGRRVSVLGDWNSGEEASAFLRQVRDAACLSFGTVLSPDYNAAHSDHFHFDHARSPRFSACR